MPIEIRKNFHHELDGIRDDVVRLAGLVTEGLARGTPAFLDGDLVAADEIIQNDDVIDAMTIDIEERSFQLLALQQPMASDLRAIVTAIRIAPELERTHDLVTNIMKATRRTYGTPLSPKIRGLVEQLGTQVHRLYRLAIDAYIDRNTALADALDDMDDEIDDLHRQYIAAIFEIREGREIDLAIAVQLALVGRFYERMGDHAVNIGERVHYLVTGWLPEHTGAARLAARGANEVPDA
jgi:phosphate transport system protein